MNNKEEVTREIMYEIGLFLKKNMPSLKQVLIGFPESNVTLNVPSMTITMQDPGYQPEVQPYEWKQKTQPKPGATDAKYQYLYVYGEYNAALQLDIWTANKEERYRLLDQFKKAMLKNWPDLSIILPMANYYDVLCRYDFENYNIQDDGELTSQTKEWRVKIDLLAHCKAVHSVEEFAIIETEVDIGDSSSELPEDEKGRVDTTVTIEI